jgi:hypothetical protein
MRPTDTTRAIKLFLQTLDVALVESLKGPLQPEDVAYMRAAASMLAAKIDKDDVVKWMGMPGSVQ